MIVITHDELDAGQAVSEVVPPGGWRDGHVRRHDSGQHCRTPGPVPGL